MLEWIKLAKIWQNNCIILPTLMFLLILLIILKDLFVNALKNLYQTYRTIPWIDVLLLNVLSLLNFLFEKDQKISTLRCLINVSHTFINFKDFSHQYFLIRNRTFIRFESIIAQTKFIVLFYKNYSGFKV